MPKGKKRKPDLRKIRTSKTYTLHDIALALDRHIATIQAWTRDGLPTLDGNKPPIVLGADLKTWLEDKWAARKQTCKVDELFCMKCKAPKRPKPNSTTFKPHNEKTVRIIANCSHCGTRMGKVASKTKLAEIKTAFRTLQPHKQHLSGCSNTRSKPTQNHSTITPSTIPKSLEQISLDFGDLTMGRNMQNQTKENANGKTKPNQ